MTHRLISALNQLSQFALTQHNEPGTAIHSLTGARITANPSSTSDDDMLTVELPGGKPFGVVGPLYLRLQIMEHSAHELHDPYEGEGKIAAMGRELLEHFERKYGFGQS